MVRRAVTLSIFLCLLGIHTFAQKDSAKGYVHKGLLRAALTYSVGKMSQLDISNVYVTGNMEYYADSKISVRGDGYYFVNSLNNITYLKQNHQLYFGACYNFPVHSHLNPFVGFQPGLAYTQMNASYVLSTPVTFNPLLSVVTGVNYFAEKWFHIMLNVRYCAGKHLDENVLFNLNELSFSFGLGWDINVIKNKCYSYKFLAH